MFTKVGKERGFSPPNRAQYELQCEPDGAFLIGAPGTVAAKMLRISADLGGITRMAMQMTNVRLAHANLLHAIELLGTEAAPLVRSHDLPVSS
jgi:alkanesulfonate monooxygenase SsuD/methylene tetrahydromethanopterin reductase-like flavin-dependent oxidoreductase (luciferase family)